MVNTKQGYFIALLPLFFIHWTVLHYYRLFSHYVALQLTFIHCFSHHIHWFQCFIVHIIFLLFVKSSKSSYQHRFESV